MEIPAPDDERRLDRIGHRSPRDRAWLGAAGRLAGRGVERHDLQPAPEAAEGEPRSPLGIHDVIGVDRVVIVLGRRSERSEENTTALQSQMRISYADVC